MTNEITIKGDRELIAKLNKLKPKNQRAAMKAIGLHMTGKMKVYPPAPATSKYIRGRSPGSESLGKRWDIKAKQQEVSVFNTASYARYVQGDDTQAWFHKLTGWQALRATAQKNMDEMVAILKKSIDRILEHG